MTDRIFTYERATSGEEKKGGRGIVIVGIKAISKKQQPEDKCFPTLDTVCSAAVDGGAMGPIWGGKIEIGRSIWGMDGLVDVPPAIRGKRETERVGQREDSPKMTRRLGTAWNG
uniref:Uncharacterized protein n=1 Tax=Globodera rostochiensis TaxID=31243 RepID=A0A914H2W6_GLORO